MNVALQELSKRFLFSQHHKWGTLMQALVKLGVSTMQGGGEERHATIHITGGNGIVGKGGISGHGVGREI